MEGGEFAQATAYVGVSAGVGLVTGPFLAKLLMNRYETKWCYFASMCMAGIGLLQIQLKFKETLPIEQRCAFPKISDMQPLSFLQGKILNMNVRPTLIPSTFANTNALVLQIGHRLCPFVKKCFSKIHHFKSVCFYYVHSSFSSFHLFMYRRDILMS